MVKIKHTFLVILITLLVFRVSGAKDSRFVSHYPNVRLIIRTYNHDHYLLPDAMTTAGIITVLGLGVGGIKFYNYMFPAIENSKLCRCPLESLDLNETQMPVPIAARVNRQVEKDTNENFNQYFKESQTLEEIKKQAETAELKYLDAKSIYEYIKIKEDLYEVKQGVNIITEIDEAAHKAAKLANSKFYKILYNQDAQEAASSAQNFAQKAKQYLIRSELILLKLQEAKILEEIQEEERRALAIVSYIEVLCEDKIQNIDEIEIAVKGAEEAADRAFSKAAKIALMQEAQSAAAAAYRHAQKAKKMCYKNL